MTSITNESIDWINDDYINLILSKLEDNGNVKLVDFKVISGSAQGENMIGVIYRVFINYTVDGIEQTKSIILKISPTTGALAELLKEYKVFEGESYIYSKILHDSYDLLSEFKMSPRLIYGDDKAMVLEDLSKLDFVLADRKSYFDLTRAKLVLEKIAKFHALTASMYQKDQSTMENYMSTVHCSEDMTPFSIFIEVSLQESLETIRSSDELKEYVQFFENFDIVQVERSIYSRTSNDKFQVLNHGDLWINNVLFKYNEDKEPVDAALIDYQESFFGSPGIDFNHFLYTSCCYDIHANHIDELIEFYYENLVATLKQLNYEKIPSLDDIRYEMKSKVLQGLIALISVVPVQMIENAEHANPEVFLDDSEEANAIRREVYGNPFFLDVLKVLLPGLKRRGAFKQGDL